MDFKLFIKELINVLSIWKGCLSCMSIVKIIDNYAIRKDLFDIIVNKMNNCIPIIKNLIRRKSKKKYLLMYPRIKYYFLFAILIE